MRIYKRNDPSTRYVPNGAKELPDPESDALVYVHKAPSGRLSALGYCARRAKPDWHYTFRHELDLARQIQRYFTERRRTLVNKRQTKQAKPRALEVGSILHTSWGYDQTNVEFFQVTRLIGRTMVELRELAQARKSEGWCRDACAPLPEEYIGEPIRRKVCSDGTSVRIDDVRRAWLGSGVRRATSYA